MRTEPETNDLAEELEVDPCKKKCFSKKGARSTLNYNKKNAKKYRKENRCYYCEKCNAWHLTSKDPIEIPLENID